MALTIRDIIEKNILPGTVLMTGRENAGNAVRWVNIMEILDSIDRVKSGELLITTGYDLDKAQEHRNLVARLKANGIAGLMIQTGYYIDKIPVYLLEAGRKHQFPILELPARYSFSELLHTMIREIMKEDVLDNSPFLDYGYFFPRAEKKLQAEYVRMGLEDQKILLMALAPSAHRPEKTVFEYLADLRDEGTQEEREAGRSAESEEELLAVQELIRSYLVNHCKTYLADWVNGSQAVYLAAFESTAALRTAQLDLHGILVRLSETQGVDFYGAADPVADIPALERSFRHCMDGMRLLNSILALRGLYLHQQNDFLKLSMSKYQESRLTMRENPVLQALLRKDRETDGRWVETVRTFLEENCNITQTAKRLYIHRHTLLYRLETIAESTGMDFEDYYSRLYLSAAIHIHDYYGD